MFDSKCLVCSESYARSVGKDISQASSAKCIIVFYFNKLSFNVYRTSDESNKEKFARYSVSVFSHVHGFASYYLHGFFISANIFEAIKTIFIVNDS